MFEDCYLRLGRAPFVSCAPLTVPLLSSLYALPEIADTPLREVADFTGTGFPWSASFEAAPEQTINAVAAMLRQLMLCTKDLEPGSLDIPDLPDNKRATLHSYALVRLWASHPNAAPADLRKLKALLSCQASDALQPMSVIWDRASTCLTPFEQAVIEHLEKHHGVCSAGDPDVERLILARQAPSASPGSLAGHLQRRLLDPSAAPIAGDDSAAVLSVRDSLTECEAATAIIQHWLAQDESLTPSQIGVILPGADYPFYLAESFAAAGLAPSSLPISAPRRNVGAEAVLSFVQSRRRPAPAMALASLYCSPVLAWPCEIGNALAAEAVEGNFRPWLAKTLEGKQAALFDLIRAPAPASTGQLKDELRRFAKLLSDDDGLRDDVFEAKAHAFRVIAALGPADSTLDWDKAVQGAASYAELPARRGPYYVGGVPIMLAHELPTRKFRKLLILGFNDGAYPSPPSGNPFFLDSEIAKLAEHSNIALPCQASQLDRSLRRFQQQLGSASEQVILLMAERDRSGSALSPSSSLPLIARLIEGFEDPEDCVQSIDRAEGTVWERLIAWRERPAVAPHEMPEIPVHFALDCNLLALRQREDGSLSPQSPSRLEKLLVSPLAWLLAELGASHVSWQPEELDVMLRGSLAHEVFERLFPPGSDHPDDEAIDAKAPELLMDRIRAIAPFLQASAWVVERNVLEAEIIKAGKQWSAILKALGAEIVGNEFWLAGEFDGHPVHGKADCLLKLPGGQPIVVDYKKSSAGGRRQRLEKQCDLQVDLYRRMSVRLGEAPSDAVTQISSALTGWAKLPAVAYHTLNDGGFLINGIDVLDCAHAELVPGEIAANATALLKARFAALRAGRVETNTLADEKYFKTQASLGTYALADSPLIAAFMRQDTAPSVNLTGDADD